MRFAHIETQGGKSVSTMRTSNEGTELPHQESHSKQSHFSQRMQTSTTLHSRGFSVFKEEADKVLKIHEIVIGNRQCCHSEWQSRFGDSLMPQVLCFVKSANTNQGNENQVYTATQHCSKTLCGTSHKKAKTKQTQNSTSIQTINISHQETAASTKLALCAV